MHEVTSIDAARPKVLEFFAGIGLARMGLESAGFRVVWANDYEADKKALYDLNFTESLVHDHRFALGDIGQVLGTDVPTGTSLAWASSPCTDLSLAGGRAGLAGPQSGTFWHFVRLLDELGDDRPSTIVLENVVGLATSHGGDDLVAAIRAFNDLGYSIDVLSIDARRFVPQSRPRLFLIGTADPVNVVDNEPSVLRPDWLTWVFDEPSLRTHRAALPDVPPLLENGLGQVIESIAPSDDRWWDKNRVDAFVSSLSAIQSERVALLQSRTETCFRTAYRRTRNGVAVWEVRPDDISGCLRTARGGSSKQAVVRMGGGNLQVRWMTPREYARLMGAPEYELGNTRSSQAMFGFGDAVAVPVVEWLAKHYLMPLIKGRSAESAIPRRVSLSS